MTAKCYLCGAACAVCDAARRVHMCKCGCGRSLVGRNSNAVWATRSCYSRARNKRRREERGEPRGPYAPKQPPAQQEGG